MGKIQLLTDKNFEQRIKGAGIVLIDFYADWCMPCKQLTSILEEIAEENKDIKIYKIDVEENTKYVQKYNINSIPMLILLNNKEVAYKITGLTSKEDIQEKINKVKD
ncbi:MAG: thioredoxin [archaeon]